MTARGYGGSASRRSGGFVGLYPDERPLRSLECSRVAADKGERKSADESANAGSTAGAVVAAMGAAAASVAGHPLESMLGAGAFAALQPFLASGFTWIGDVVTRGASRSGRRIENLLTDLDASPEQRELLIKALELARSTSLDTKRFAIAEALARGVTSAEAAVGETDFLRLLADLDAAHVEALQILGTANDLQRPALLLGGAYYEPDDLGKISPVLRGHEQRLLACSRVTDSPSTALLRACGPFRTLGTSRHTAWMFSHGSKRTSPRA